MSTLSPDTLREAAKLLVEVFGDRATINTQLRFIAPERDYEYYVAGQKTLPNAVVDIIVGMFRDDSLTDLADALHGAAQREDLQTRAETLRQTLLSLYEQAEEEKAPGRTTRGSSDPLGKYHFLGHGDQCNAFMKFLGDAMQQPDRILLSVICGSPTQLVREHCDRLNKVELATFFKHTEREAHPLYSSGMLSLIDIKFVQGAEDVALRMLDVTLGTRLGTTMEPGKPPPDALISEVEAALRDWGNACSFAIKISEDVIAQADDPVFHKTIGGIRIVIDVLDAAIRRIDDWRFGLSVCIEIDDEAEALPTGFIAALKDTAVADRHHIGDALGDISRTDAHDWLTEPFVKGCIEPGTDRIALRANLESLFLPAGFPKGVAPSDEDYVTLPLMNFTVALERVAADFGFRSMEKS